MMKCEPIFEAVEAIAQGGAHSSAHATTHSTTQDDPYIIFLSPEGEVFTDKIARELSTQMRLLFVCGH